MEIILLLTAVCAAGVLTTVRLALAGARADERRRREEEDFKIRLAERTRGLNDRLIRLETDRRLLAEADHRKARLLIALNERLRDPLHLIQGFVDLTQARSRTDEQEGLTHRQAQALDQIAAASGRLVAVTDELSDLARAETGRLDLKIERLDALVMLRRAVQAQEARARAMDVVVHAPEPMAGLGVRADRLLLGQILTAVLAQAMARTPPGGRVVIEARRDDAAVRLAIRDGGPPHSIRGRARVLRPFADRDGAGLASARRWAEAMDGGLDFADPDGPVSTLILTLPADGTVAANTSTGPRLPSATVLYVDDDPVAVTMMRQILATLGPVALHAAASGAEATHLARALKPDLILTELTLPDMEGFELRASLACDLLTRDIPVLALSARTGPMDWRRARDAGMTACLAKPVEIGSLTAAVAAALTAARAPAPSSVATSRRSTEISLA